MSGADSPVLPVAMNAVSMPCRVTWARRHGLRAVSNHLTCSATRDANLPQVSPMLLDAQVSSGISRELPLGTDGNFKTLEVPLTQKKRVPEHALAVTEGFLTLCRTCSHTLRSQVGWARR